MVAEIDTTWVGEGLGPPEIFTAVGAGSFWLTHVDAGDVVRVGLSDGGVQLQRSYRRSAPDLGELLIDLKADDFVRAAVVEALRGIEG